MRLLQLGVVSLLAACHPAPAPAPPPVVIAPAPVASEHSEDAGVLAPLVAPLVVVTLEPEDHPVTGLVAPQRGATQLTLRQGPAEVTGGLTTEVVQRILRPWTSSLAWWPRSRSSPSSPAKAPPAKA